MPTSSGPISRRTSSRPMSSPGSPPAGCWFGRGPPWGAKGRSGSRLAPRPRTSDSWMRSESWCSGHDVSTSVSVTQPQSGARAPGRERRADRRPLWSRRWPWVVVGVLAVSTLFVIASDMRPSYDGFGFLVWGRQVLHWNLNTDGAPSWKPLPFLFTVPYAVAGRSQMWLWMITAVAGAVAGSVFAGRVAFRLTGVGGAR